MGSGSGAAGREENLDLLRCRPDRGLRIPGGMGRLRPGGPCRDAAAGSYAVTACFWSRLVTWMLRGLAASWTGMARVSTPAA